MVHFEQWEGFEGRIWREEVNVRDFIQKNYKPYAGDERFLAGPTEATDKLWGILQKLQKEERAKGGVGMIVLENTRVDDKHGVAAECQASVARDEQIAPRVQKGDLRLLHLHGALGPKRHGMLAEQLKQPQRPGPLIEKEQDIAVHLRFLPDGVALM